jgi:hypothetical protein
MLTALLLAAALAVTPVPPVPSAATTAPPLPWTFGMTPQEVSAVADHGPYKSFGNGDLETYRGVFEGHEENVQFFFTDGRLRRIGIYLYEGEDAAAAAREWSGLHATLARHYGAVETPGNVESATGAVAEASFTANALALVGERGKAQMAPVDQPVDAFLFASFTRVDGEGGRQFYVVVLNLDPPH